MEIDTLQIKIAKARTEMSPESRQAIDAVNWKQIILGMNSKFNSEQIENLQTETELLLCGLTSTIDFPKELETRMKLPKSEVATLLEDMNKLIFQKMQEELENRLNNKVGEEKVYPNTPFFTDPNFASIPKEVQRAVSSSMWKERLYAIAEKYNLPIDKMGELENITTKTISGSIKTDQYENEVVTKMNLPSGKSKEMVTEINESIFKNIKDSMVNNSKTQDNLGSSVPLPPYAIPKTINNEIEIPLPPYKENIADKPSINKIELKDVVKNTIPINSNFSNSETDMYREHGIEIMPEHNYMAPIVEGSVTQKEDAPILNYNSPINTPVKAENNSNDPITKSNIVTDKLFGKTVSQTVVTDYSLPKINSQLQSLSRMQGEAQKKPHDPYHEVI